ncbi:hypothetical protein [Maribacter dokdonensis]|uniref:hypothetical protein n=1 Tax=Maribacter dokdonensis TaxID=320912 RepID=UPI00329A7382
MKIRTFFKLRINIEALDLISPKYQKCAKFYKGELIIDEKNNHEIQLKIFFDEKENLDRKISLWYHKYDLNLIQYFKVIEIEEPKNLIEIDFLNYRCKEIQKSTSFYEFDLKYFIVKLTGIKTTFLNSEKLASTIYLNQQSFDLIELNYYYNQNIFLDDEDYTWKPRNKIENYIKFGKISFKPEHRFFRTTKNHSEKILIQKEPRLSLEYSNLDVKEIKKHIELLCTLYSFYSLENIDYSISRIHTKDKLHIEVRDVSSNITKDYHGIFRWEFFQNPLNLLINVNAVHLLENSKFYRNIVNRFIYSLKTNGESKFMILYSILEQIRNNYILDKKIEKEKAGNIPNLKKVTEEYKFNLSKTQTDKFIKDILENIIDIISEEDKELFKKEIKYKLTPIKVVSMINQFQSLFDYIEINPVDFKLDFLELKRLRDSIFHGRPVNDNLKVLNSANLNKCLPKFVGTVILKYSGINDLKEINKIEI